MTYEMIFLTYLEFFMFITKVLNKGYQADNCAICNCGFSLVVRIHKCKRCNRFVCSTCSKSKGHFIQENGEKSEKTHRMCALCSEDVESIKNTIQNYEMSWATTSNFSKVWMAKMYWIVYPQPGQGLRLRQLPAALPPQ